MITWVRIRARLTDWDIAKVQKSVRVTAQKRPSLRDGLPPKPRVSAKGTETRSILADLR